MVQTIVFKGPQGVHTLYNALEKKSKPFVSSDDFGGHIKDLNDVFVCLGMLQHDYEIDISIRPKKTVSEKDGIFFKLLDSLLKTNKNLLSILRHIAEKKLFPESLALEKLSPMQRKISGLVKQGFTYTQIAKKLSISPHTVNGHRKKAIKVLGVKDAKELTAFLQRFD